MAYSEDYRRAAIEYREKGHRFAEQVKKFIEHSIEKGITPEDIAKLANYS